MSWDFTPEYVNTPISDSDTFRPNLLPTHKFESRKDDFNRFSHYLKYVNDDPFGDKDDNCKSLILH